MSKWLMEPVAVPRIFLFVGAFATFFAVLRGVLLIIGPPPA